jgi:hypothetical protein
LRRGGVVLKPQKAKELTNVAKEVLVLKKSPDKEPLRFYLNERCDHRCYCYFKQRKAEQITIFGMLTIVYFLNKEELTNKQKAR